MLMLGQYFSASISDLTRSQLTSSRMAVRKRSILALGHLVPCCSPALFSQLTGHLLTELAKGPPTSMTRTYIQCLATISRQGGHRVGEIYVLRNSLPKSLHWLSACFYVFAKSPHDLSSPYFSNGLAIYEPNCTFI